ncbi:hypothetical protein C7N43_08355 [Sphingobacteriales bacterium UPWRP_1]|nr:hypothetical protein C7N43_08355 [Sphingobacteriales bacterium UPWRP_1]
MSGIRIFWFPKKKLSQYTQPLAKKPRFEKKSLMEIKLPDTIEACHEMIRELLAIIAALENRVSKLERRLGQNNGNSHLPPSSDGFKKKPDLVGKQHKRWGQEGHKGNTLKMVEQPDRVVVLKVEGCSGCGQQEDLL